MHCGSFELKSSRVERGSSLSELGSLDVDGNSRLAPLQRESWTKQFAYSRATLLVSISLHDSSLEPHSVDVLWVPSLDLRVLDVCISLRVYSIMLKKATVMAKSRSASTIPCSDTRVRSSYIDLRRLQCPFPYLGASHYPRSIVFSCKSEGSERVSCAS
jgi:hypothetical protein